MTLGIIASNEPIVVAAYTISGMVAGILNRFGKIGVICGFVLGNVILSYAANGLVANLILFREILIAGLALLAVPKNINLDIENIIRDERFLPKGEIRRLNKSKETAEKLNDVSQAVQDMAENYKNVTQNLSEEEIREQNKQKFITELLNNIDYMEDNLLYDNIEDVEGEVVDQVFSRLIENQFIKEDELVKILAKNNNYVIGFDKNEQKAKSDIEKMTQAINSAYRVSKMNFIWGVRLKEEKKNFETQLEGVSKAISEIAENINEENETEEQNSDKKEEAIILLKQKEILVQEISITKKGNDRYRVELYIEENDKEDLDENIINILTKVLGEKVIIKSSKKIKNENVIKFEVISDDKYILSFGQSMAIKERNDGFW